MKIYIDFDDVICETAKHFTVLAKELFGIELPYSQVQFFNLQKSFQINDEQYTELMKAGHVPETLLAYEETPGASATINKWVDAGHQVSIITGRPFDSYEPSRKWLDDHGLERVPLFCVDKYGRESFNQDCSYSMTLAELYDMTFDFAVEDSPAAFEHVLHFENCTVAVFDRPWNRQTEFPNDRFVRCADWQEIDRLLENRIKNTAKFHLPGLFEFYEFYKVFLPLFYEHREFFYDWAEIGSIYGAPADCIWGGGRVGFGEDNAEDVLALLREYGISGRLTFSNSLLREEHLLDRKCNRLCQMFATNRDSTDMASRDTDEQVATFGSVANGVIVYSDLLADYLQKNYPELYLVSSTTKVLTEFDQFLQEVRREEFQYVVPDFRLNNKVELLQGLSAKEKDKVEFLINECCYIGCTDRKACYESVSRKALGENCPDHVCRAPGAGKGYLFSKAMKNPAFISVADIKDFYLPAGFSNFKIEGRGLGSAILLEFLLYYMTKPEYQLQVREKIYLDSMLYLF